MPGTAYIQSTSMTFMKHDWPMLRMARKRSQFVGWKSGLSPPVAGARVLAVHAEAVR